MAQLKDTNRNTANCCFKQECMKKTFVSTKSVNKNIRLNKKCQQKHSSQQKVSTKTFFSTKSVNENILLNKKCQQKLNKKTKSPAHETNPNLLKP